MGLKYIYFSFNENMIMQMIGQVYINRGLSNIPMVQFLVSSSKENGAPIPDAIEIRF